MIRVAPSPLALCVNVAPFTPSRVPPPPSTLKALAFENDVYAGQENVTSRPRIRYTLEQLRGLAPVQTESPASAQHWPRGVVLKLDSLVKDEFDDDDDDEDLEEPSSVSHPSKSPASLSFLNSTSSSDDHSLNTTTCPPSTGGLTADFCPTSPIGPSDASAAHYGLLVTPNGDGKRIRYGPNTPTTAPPRMHGNADDLMTPMRAKTPATKIKTLETDRRRLGQRGKQINYGKATLGYLMCKASNKDVSADKLAELPRTPRDSQKCSKRCWDAQVRDWRVRLHAYDPKSEQEWREAYDKFPRECLDLALALSKNATQFSLTQCMPPADIMEEALQSAALAVKRAPVARSLGDMLEDAENDEENEEEEDKM